jgi:hypothetical protein
LGADTLAMLRELLGYPDEDLQRLAEAGVIAGVGLGEGEGES